MSFEMETKEKFIEDLEGEKPKIYPGDKSKIFPSGEKSKPSAPLYPTLITNTQSNETNTIYRLNRTNAILEELKKEKKHYESTYKKYKLIHKTIYTTQLCCNTTSVLTGGCAVATLSSGVGVVASIPLGLVGMVTGGLGIIFGTFDQKALKKMKKHSKLTQLCQSIDSQILKKYLSDQVITKEEFTEILSVMEKYYTDKEEIRTKNILVGNLENLKTEFIEKGKKLAYFEAMNNQNK